ncbi:hypothetical protein JG688_00013751 [Phytophthora aleatoria]|uniref:Uncharacterized protein n=1 Tax=Phytophthora aleatoria TaxID=2496075 RepID=A0A8J5LY53_9STRA|nr:hypothetical protein JG688_00013751 [Phytophthora aleatoria]
MPGAIKQHALNALSSRKTDGKGLRVAIVHAKWNAEEQAKERAGLSDKGHNHGTEWAQTAIEMGRLRDATLKGGCPMRPHEHLPYHSLTNCPFFTVSTWLHIATIGALGFVAAAAAKKLA